MKLINITSVILIAIFFSGCVAVTSSSVTFKSGVNSRFFIGKDNVYVNDGLWYLKAVYPADSSANFEGERYNFFIFSKPTGISYNKEFIILKRELPKEPVRYMIVKMRNDSLIRYYPAKNEKKFIELRNKLNVPDSLKFISIGQ